MAFQTTSAQDQDDEEIVNDGFFPSISINLARESMRSDGTISVQRLKDALVSGIINTNQELKTWKSEHLLNNHATLADIPAMTINNESINVYNYRRAVFCFAKANLVERFRDYDSTNEGNKRADELITSIDDLWRDYRWAINDLLQISRNTVELI